MSARVLITGGAGFLSSYLVDRMLAEWCEVLCAHNSHTGNKSNIAHLHANPRFELLRHDMTFPVYVEVDQIYNLACPVSPVQYQAYGRRMDANDGRVVSDFIVQALRHEPTTIFGDGSQTRSFCYVDDLIEGRVRL